MVAVFIGHGECYGLSEKEVQEAIISAIDDGVTEFLSGGMGGFDWMCARQVHLLKSEYPMIKNYLVIPYLTFNPVSKEYFDELIYPEGFEKYHFKAAIPARNRYMVDNAQYAICYINHSWGGAYKTYSRAEKKKLAVVNLGKYSVSE